MDFGLESSEGWMVCAPSSIIEIFPCFFNFCTEFCSSRLLSFGEKYEPSGWGHLELMLDPEPARRTFAWVSWIPKYGFSALALPRHSPSETHPRKSSSAKSYVNWYLSCISCHTLTIIFICIEASVFAIPSNFDSLGKHNSIVTDYFICFTIIPSKIQRINSRIRNIRSRLRISWAYMKWASSDTTRIIIALNTLNSLKIRI